MNKKRIVLAGGSGFLGQALAKELLQRDYEVVVLTRELRERDEDDEVKEVEWDGENPGEWTKCLDGAEAVVNLAGRNINCRHTPENLREITESRVNPVRAIAAAICHVKRPPRATTASLDRTANSSCPATWFETSRLAATMNALTASSTCTKLSGSSPLTIESPFLVRSASSIIGMRLRRNCAGPSV